MADKHLKIILVYATGLFCLESALSTTTDQQQEEYCLHDSFHPKCIKNEVILIKSARFGRMRIGRCITAQEINRFGPMMGEDPQYLGCSVDVLPIVSGKCSGKSECEIRVVDIFAGKDTPCLPGLTKYLEVSYVCLNTVDESRSCTVTATADPVNIIASPKSRKICGTNSQPWIVEAALGKKVRLTLIELNDLHSEQDQQQQRQPCYRNIQGVIIDKIGKRNVSICRDQEQREVLIYSSNGNAVSIIFNEPRRSESDDSTKEFLIKIEAIGCSDIVPPEDTWLKRSDDVISIGCYYSRQSWRLNCQYGKWIGVIGNCSVESFVEVEPEKVEQKATISEDEQVLAIVAIVGCTLAVCMAIVCTGAVCLRRFYVQSKRDRTYKTLSCNYDLNGDNTTGPRLRSQTPANFSANDSHCSNEPQMPTYSVYAGDGSFHDHVSNK